MIAGLSKFIEEQENMNDIIIAGDLNKDISLKDIKRFFIEQGLFDIHNIVNETEDRQMDSTYKYGSKYIDIVAATIGIL